MNADVGFLVDLFVKFERLPYIINLWKKSDSSIILVHHINRVGDARPVKHMLSENLSVLPGPGVMGINSRPYKGVAIYL
jgi:hypothetical protein